MVAAGKLSAIDVDANKVFLGKPNSSGVPEYLDTPSDQECFLETSAGNRPITTPISTASPHAMRPSLALIDSQFWYHAEFFDAAQLRRLFGDAVDPGGSVIEFNRLFEPRPDIPPVLTDPALICYYLFYPGHEQPLAGCIDPETHLLYEKARDFGSFAGEWSCIALLLERNRLERGVRAEMGRVEQSQCRRDQRRRPGSPLQDAHPSLERDADVRAYPSSVRSRQGKPRSLPSRANAPAAHVG